MHFNSTRQGDSEPRPYRLLETKRGLIQHNISKFSSSIAIEGDLHVSGTNSDDELQHPLEMYKSMHTTNGKRDNKSFKYVHCWRVLSLEPKWMDYRSGRNITAKSASSTSTGPVQHMSGTPVDE